MPGGKMKVSSKPHKAKKKAGKPCKVDRTQPKITNFTCQKKITKVPKKDPNVPEKNADGYLIKKCTYFEEVDDWYYIPDGYGEKFERQYRFRDRDPLPCEHCRLCPCMKYEYYEEITTEGIRLKNNRDFCGPGKMCSYLEVDERLESKTVCEILSDEARKILVWLFGKRRAKKMSIPKCVRDDIWYFADIVNSDTSYCSNSDEEENEFWAEIESRFNY